MIEINKVCKYVNGSSLDSRLKAFPVKYTVFTRSFYIKLQKVLPLH